MSSLEMLLNFSAGIKIIWDINLSESHSNILDIDIPTFSVTESRLLTDCWRLLTRVLMLTTLVSTLLAWVSRSLNMVSACLSRLDICLMTMTMLWWETYSSSLSTLSGIIM